MENKTAEEMITRGTGNFINCTDYDDAISVIKNLQQQLAEKDKDIERFTIGLHEWLHEEGYEWGNKPHQMYRGGKYFWTKDLIELYKQSLNK